MVDHLNKARRSWNMSRIRSLNTIPEQSVRSALHSLRFAVVQNLASLPGSPDFALPRHRIAIFVHGCFWHRHPKCKFSYTPKTNGLFWATKFKCNAERDRRVARELMLLGWAVIVVWGCHTKDFQGLRARLRRTTGAVRANRSWEATQSQGGANRAPNIPRTKSGFTDLSDSITEVKHGKRPKARGKENILAVKKHAKQIACR